MGGKAGRQSLAETLRRAVRGSGRTLSAVALAVGLLIPTQKAEIERFIAANGWELVGWYVDECKSGSRIEGRDEFKRALADAALDVYDVLVPYDTTRHGRSGIDIMTTAQMLKQLGKHV